MSLDFSGLPRPNNAPPAGSCVRLETVEPGVYMLVLDPPHRKLAVLDLPLLVDLDERLTKLEAKPDLRGLVIAGRTPTSFAAGADIDAIGDVTDPQLVERMVSQVQGLFQRIYLLSKRKPAVTTVAAIGGPVPGGAYELALACKWIVASDDRSTRIGLPETMLGILPAWGGTTRLPRRIGVPMALDAILTGRLYPAQVALKRGMIDRLTKADYLMRVAVDIAAGRERPKRKSRGKLAWLVDKNPLATAIIAKKARAQVLEKTGGHYPAPLAAIEIACEAPRTSIAGSLDAEVQAVKVLAVSPVCKNLVGIFRLSEEAKKLGQDADGNKPEPIRRLGVLGAGVMGGAIASLGAEKGLKVRLRDLSRDALDEALVDHRQVIEAKRKKRRMQPQDALAAIDHLDVTTDPVGFGGTELVIEAVAEKLSVKRIVFAEMAALLAPEAILATNTSSLSVTDIAAEIPHPERVVGMHFFNPVRKMPLVEIIPGEQTAPEVVTRTAALALRMGKTPVVVKDVAGFLVNRLLGPYLDEALRLFAGGVFPGQLEHALEHFGMPMGPLKLVDEVGFDIARHASESLHAAYGARMQPTDALDGISSPQRLGKKTGLGFFKHGKGKPHLAEDLREFTVRKSGAEGLRLDDAQVVDRCVLAMLNEAARCIEEDVVEGPRELDLATIFGMGFPPFRGGLLRYADTRGAAEIVERLRAIQASPDVASRGAGAGRFEPAEILVDMAARGGTFHA